MRQARPDQLEAGGDQLIGLSAGEDVPAATESEFYDVVGTREAGGGRWGTPAQVVTNALRALDRPRLPSAASGRANPLGGAVMRLIPRHVLLNLYGRLTYRQG